MYAGCNHYGDEGRITRVSLVRFEHERGRLFTVVSLQGESRVGRELAVPDEVYRSVARNEAVGEDGSDEGTDWISAYAPPGQKARG